MEVIEIFFGDDPFGPEDEVLALYQNGTLELPDGAVLNFDSICSAELTRVGGDMTALCKRWGIDRRVLARLLWGYIMRSA